MECRNYIGGEWTDLGQVEMREIRNPANTDEIVGRCPMAQREHVQQAVDAAAGAFPAWRALTYQERAGIIEKASEILEAKADEIGRILTREEGKTFAEARGEVIHGADLLRSYASLARQAWGGVFSPAKPDTFLYTLREPLGVVSTISPWNYPITIPCRKIPAALLGGNTVIFKPSQLTPFTGWHMAKAFEEAGLPSGVLNMVTGSGAVVGDEMVRNPIIRAISFTGSNEVGREIAGVAAGHGAKAQLELGGKNPLIILKDAELERATDLAMDGAMKGTGQKCTATSRVIVEREIAADFVEMLLEKVKRITTGDGMNPDIYMGPLVSETQRQTVLEYIRIGKEEGARLLCGGGIPSGAEYDKGWFVDATVFDNVDPDMRIAREEIFGPVLSVLVADDFDEAIEIANSVDYGLSAAICTRDVERIMDFVNRIEAGVIRVNHHTSSTDTHVPFGGVKGSSSGFREHGIMAVEFFTQVKTVYIQPLSQ